REVTLLGADMDDNIYFGLLNSEGRVEELRYGKYDAGYTEGWHSMTLSNPLARQDLLFSMTRQPYIDLRQSFEVIDLIDGSRTGYKAGYRLVSVLDKYVVSTDGVYINFKDMKGDSDE
ncbi:MAG TPA: hypothetical protein DD727_09085, partial [Clostridiales bacterium]|nr:hypothetical protein [Clostridiales bacterium]